MGFDTISYFLFLYGLCCLFWFWNASAGLLLGASLLFYTSFGAWPLLLLLGQILLCFFGARLLPARKRPWLLAGLLTLTFLPLLLVKIAEAGQWGWAFPLGLSFFTFHCASYLIDVARGIAAPEPSLKKLSLYIAFFPQLIAGPITRAGEVLPQLASLSRPANLQAKRSLWRIYLGLFKKFAIANVIGLLAKEVFLNPANYHGVLVLFAVLAGRYFIFADFSGYSDIAIGSARLLGIELPENFRRPFASVSIAEYWRRWHITLSAWIRDYLFYPLAASPAGSAGPYPILLLTFLLLGLWHGLRWNFLLYGLWHGCFLVLHDATRAPRLRIWKALGVSEGLVPQWLFTWGTFLLIVCPPTVLFLTPTPADAFAVLGALAQESGRTFVRGVSWYHLASAEASIVALELYQWLGARMDCFARFEALPRALRWLCVLLAVLWLAFAGEFSSELNFLYFRF